MAFITKITCSKCGKEWTGPANQYGPNICDECFGRMLDESKQKYFDGLKGLSLEERVSKIEKWIYDHGDHEVDLSNMKY
jgi:threonine synthase